MQTDSEFFHLMADSPNAYHRQNWARLKPEAKNPIQVSHMST